ncbi:MAG TPA: hypothetical protein VFZ46_05785 [Nitrososphaeraceae archaeon]
MNNNSSYQIIHILSLIVVIISLHSFTTTTHNSISNNNQFILKTFAKELKGIQLDEKLIHDEQLLVKEMLGISGSNNNNNNQEKEIVEDKSKQNTEKQEIKAKEKKNKDNKEKEKEEEKKEEKKNKEEKGVEIKESDEGYEDSWANADKDLITKYNYRNLAIPKVYQTAPDGETYRFNKNNPNDMVQLDETKKDYVFSKQNEDGSWRIDEGRPRIDIFTKDAGILDDAQILEKNLTKSGIQSWNYSELKEIGYWYKPTDWKNVEITLIFKLLDSARSKGEEHAISVVTRSISHSEIYDDGKDDDPPFYCGGSSYHNNISNEGQVRMKKEEFHVDYDREKYNPNVYLGNLYDKIIGFKAMVYNLDKNTAKMESWIDAENEGRGPYKKVHEKIDSGNWGDNMKVCGAEKDGQAITWSSPTIIIKANDFKFDLYDVEVREIIPPISN